MPITFIPGPACAGGNHWNVAVTLRGGNVTAPVSYDTAVEPLTEAELETLADLMIRYQISTAPNKDMTVVRAGLGTLTVGRLP